MPETASNGLLRFDDPELAGREFPYQIHDGEDDKKVSYLVANEAGDPVYLNRLLVDADVVLPLDVLRREKRVIRSIVFIQNFRPRQ